MPTTIQAFNRFMARFIVQKKRCNDLKEKLTKENKKLVEMQTQALEYLEALDTKSHKKGNVTVSIKDCPSVKLEDRAKFFSYLLKRKDGKDALMSMITAAGASKFYFEEEAVAISKGKGLRFKIPGMGQPSVHRTVSLRGVE